MKRYDRRTYIGKIHAKALEFERSLKGYRLLPKTKRSYGFGVSKDVHCYFCNKVYRRIECIEPINGVYIAICSTCSLKLIKTPFEELSENDIIKLLNFNKTVNPPSVQGGFNSEIKEEKSSDV